MPEILAELRREHASIASVLGVLERQLLAFESASHADYELIEATVDYFSGFPDRCHHPKEDPVYAMLRERDPKAAEAVGDLAANHRQLAAQLRAFAAEIAAVIGEAEWPRAALLRAARDFIDLQRRHLAAEEATFFPAAERALGPADWQALKSAINRTPDPLLGGSADTRFDGLRRVILAWEAETVAERGSADRQPV